MNDFSTTLLREKFVIRDAATDPAKISAPVIALSNRMALPLVSKNGQVRETIIVRAQNMHSCTRMAARIAQEFDEGGPIVNRQTPFDWAYAWQSITRGFESRYNPDRWIAIYARGRVIFQDGEAKRHSFLDIIEQCDARNRDDYEKAVHVAENAFQQAGKTVAIEHNSNVALILNQNNDETKCGVIVRGPTRTMTFNFTARPRAGRIPRISQCLSACAAFLEGIQLAFQSGLITQKAAFDMIDSASLEAEKGRESRQRIGRLNQAIHQFENLADVVYRPERPDFSGMILEAETAAKISLTAELERRLATGEISDEGWVV